MAIFEQTLWANPFGKMSFFRMFNFPVLIALKGVLSFQKILKDIFLTYIALKKGWKNGPIWTKTMG